MRRIRGLGDSVELSLVERIRKGPVIGTFIETASPLTVEAAGHSGMDFVVIDLEHGAIGIETAESMIRAAQYTGMAAVIRVPEIDPPLIGKLLDAGATGIQVPHVSSREDAESAVAACRYPPLGERGYMPFARANRFGYVDRLAHIENSNRDIAVIAQVEGSRGVGNVESILSCAGLTVAFIGPYDLSMSLGVPGQIDSPIVLQAIDRVAELAGRSGVALGIFAGSADVAKMWLSKGFKYVTVGLDVGILSASYLEIVKATKKGFSGRDRDS